MSRTSPPAMNPKGKQTLTVSTAAVGLTLPKNAQTAVIYVEDAAIRYWHTGDNPTATVGIQAEPGDIITIHGSLSLFKAIRRDAADAELQINYYG